nr:reverse transcriptase domain-containing protein [Tanacetum cinerariifolium]
MANADDTNRNPKPREAPVARKCSYKEFMSCQPFSFKGSERAVGLIRWFERTKSVFSCSNCTKDCKVKFSTVTLTEEALSWWNSFAQPIEIEEAYKIKWVEFKKLLIKKYCPRTEVQKMEDEFYHLIAKGNDLKTYVRRFQELATLCPTIVMPPKRTSTSAAPTMAQAAIRQLVTDSITTALEAQAANMANADDTNRNPKPREAPAARKCSYKEFMSCQPFSFKGSERAVGLIRWFERTKSVFSCSNCTKDCKVKFSTVTLIEEALSWWNSFAQPIEIEEAYKIKWVEFKKLLIKKYCPRTEVQKMEDEFYH